MKKKLCSLLAILFVFSLSTSIVGCTKADTPPTTEEDGGDAGGSEGDENGGNWTEDVPLRPRTGK